MVADYSSSTFHLTKTSGDTVTFTLTGTAVYRRTFHCGPAHVKRQRASPSFACILHSQLTIRDAGATQHVIGSGSPSTGQSRLLLSLVSGFLALQLVRHMH